MTDYLEEVEAAYSKCRGKWSMLSPLDWQLAAEWEKAGIPLFIVHRAIEDCCKKFKAKKDPGKINTLRYFDQAVRQHFTTWNRGRAGSNDKPISAPGTEQPDEDIPDDAPFEPHRPCGTCTGSMFIITARDPITWIATAMIPCPECSK